VEIKLSLALSIRHADPDLIEGDDPLADVGVPLDHGVGRRVAEETRHGILGRVAVGPEDAHGVVGALRDNLAGEVLNLRDVEPIVEPALVLGPGGAVDEQVGTLDLGRHLRDQILVHLELADLLRKYIIEVIRYAFCSSPCKLRIFCPYPPKTANLLR
jgi:hypothetical protein